VPLYDYSIKEQFLDLEGHLWFFTQQGLEGMMDMADIKIEKITRFGPSIHEYFGSSIYSKCNRKISRALNRDWFFNKYATESESGMWIRLIGKGELV